VTYVRGHASSASRLAVTILPVCQVYFTRRPRARSLQLKRLSGALGSVPALVSAMQSSLISTQSARKFRAPAFLDASEGLTLTLDYGHFITSGETSEEVHSLLPFTSHVHARGGAIGRLQTSFDENTIDFLGMLAGLQELGYVGFLALEYVWVDWKGCNRTDNVSETLLLRRALESAASKITTARMNHV
jgi:hypothetical protein